MKRILNKIDFHLQNKSLINYALGKVTEIILKENRKKKLKSLNDIVEVDFVYKTGYGFLMWINKEKVVERDFYLDDFERDYIALYRKIIKPNDTVLDIGANVGLFSLIAASKYPSVNVVAFEPSDYAFTQLELNIRLNNLTNIHPQKLLLSDREEDIPFYTCLDDAYNSLGNRPQVEVFNIEVKKSARLDSLLKQKLFSKVDVIKIDTEGAEYLIFKGGHQLLRENNAIIFTEYNRQTILGFNYTLKDYEQLLTDAGYLFFEYDYGKLRLFDSNSSQSSNLICIKSNKLYERFSRRDFK